MSLRSRCELLELTSRVLVRANTSESNAHCVARALVAAEMDGLDSHGLSRLPSYADQAYSGKVDGRADPLVMRVAPAVVQCDARCGFAFPAIEVGMRTALDAIKEVGATVLAVRNSHHFGVAGYHVEAAAERGVVAVAFSNSPAAIAPWGGALPVFGTNPIAFATPRKDRPPLVVDMSLSKAARGKVAAARSRGEAIPSDWALDAQGRLTTDPTAVLDGGSMLPLGDAKGSSLALVVEILSAALTGSSFGFEASSFFTAEGEPPKIGHFFLLLDPARFGGPAFLERLEDLLDAITSQPGTRLPGQRRLKSRSHHQAHGIEVQDLLLRELYKRAGYAE